MSDAPKWKLVPVEPTAAMVQAWVDSPRMAKAGYRAMLAAAPPAPVERSTAETVAHIAIERGYVKDLVPGVGAPDLPDGIHKLYASPPAPIETPQQAAQRRERFEALLREYGNHCWLHLYDTKTARCAVLAEYDDAREAQRTASVEQTVAEGIAAADPDPQGTFACPICGIDTPHMHPRPGRVSRTQHPVARLTIGWDRLSGGTCIYLNTLLGPIYDLHVGVYDLVLAPLPMEHNNG